MDVDTNIVEEFKDLDYGDVEFKKKIAKLSRDVTSGALNLVHLIEQLGSLLADELPSKRELGTWILSHVLSELPLNSLDSNQLNFMCTFYSDRFKDRHQVIPAVLHGVFALLKFENVSDSNVSQILTSLFHNVGCQQRQQTERKLIYDIFNSILDTKLIAVKSMGLDFVYGVISAVDGERDPKNLLYLFHWYPKFLRNVDLKHLSEEAFEVMACYFPVDFKAPPQDPNGITREALADGLALCLCSIPEFAEHCLPLALEKLESNLVIAKLDSLRLLELGCETFPLSFYSEQSSILWSQIQKEILNNPDQQLEFACLNTLTAIIKKLLSENAIDNTILKDICDTHKGSLLPDSKLFETSSKILISSAKASEFSAKFVSKEIVPILTTTFNISTTRAHKMKVLNLATTFTVIYYESVKIFDWDELKIVIGQSLKASLDEDSDLRSMGFDCLSLQIKLIPQDLRMSLYKNLERFLILPQPVSVRNSILNCFKKLGESYPSEVKNNLIFLNNNLSLEELNLFLEAIGTITPQINFINDAIDIYYNYLHKDNEEVVVITLKNLSALLENDNGRISEALYRKDFIGKLVILSENYVNRLESDENCAEDFLKVFRIIIGDLSIEDQSKILEEMFFSKIFKKFNEKRDRVSLVLLDAFLERIRKEVEINYQNLFQELTTIALGTQDSFMKNLALQLLANLLNKCPKDDLIKSYLSSIDDELMEDNIQSCDEFLAWVIKALSMRNHNDVSVLIDKLISLLKRNAEVAASFRTIINDNYVAVSSKSYCNRTLFFQQKIFTIISKKLVDNYNSDYPGFLTALGFLLENAPKNAILLQFEQISRLVLLSLDNSIDPEVLSILLKLLHNFISEKQSCIENHLGDILARLLKLSSSRSMKIRILALKCINEFAVFPIYKLLPHKADVLKQLGVSVDDRKRLVRKEAVEARSAWFLLDAPM